MPAQVSAVHLTGEAIAAFSCFTPQLETAVLLLLASGSISVFECRTHAPLNRLRSGKRSSPQPMRIEICWGCSISLTESLCASLFNPSLFFVVVVGYEYFEPSLGLQQQVHTSFRRGSLPSQTWEWCAARTLLSVAAAANVAKNRPAVVGVSWAVKADAACGRHFVRRHLAPTGWIMMPSCRWLWSSGYVWPWCRRPCHEYLWPADFSTPSGCCPVYIWPAESSTPSCLDWAWAGCGLVDFVL